MELSLKDLPDEILEHVFLQLPVHDRKSVRLVNQDWLRLCKSVSVVKNEIVVVKNGYNLDNCPLTRRSWNLRIEKLNPSYGHKFWKEQGSLLKSIEIHVNSLQSSYFFQIIEQCPKIEHIYLDVIPPENARTSSVLQGEGERCLKLEHLVSMEIRADSMKLLRSFLPPLAVAYSPNLERIRVKFLDKESTELSLTEAIQMVVLRHYDKLKDIHFGSCSLIDESFLKWLIEALGPQVTSLDVPGCPGNTNCCLQLMADKFVNLKELNLNRPILLATLRIIDMLSPLENLKLISLRGSDIKDELLSVVVSLQHLRGLDLTSCESLTAEGISNAFKGKEHFKLFDLRLGFNDCVTDTVLNAILPQLLDLKCLNLDNCYAIGNIGIAAIANNCRVLERLSLKNCCNIGNLALSINSLEWLTHLNLRGCHSLTDDNVLTLAVVALQSLDFGFAVFPLLDKKVLPVLVTNCPSLQRLYVTTDQAVPNYVHHGQKPSVIPFISDMWPSIFDFARR